MIDARNERLDHILGIMIKVGAFIMLALSLAIAGIALFSGNTKGEASIGSFEAEDFNEGWNASYNGKNEVITLPTNLDCKEGDEIVLTNTLPEDLGDGMNLMFRSSMMDVTIFVGGVLRNEYSSRLFDGNVYSIPGAYMVTPLNAEDAGKDITIRIAVKNRGNINRVRIGYGNNAWFDIIRDYLPLTLFALFSFGVGSLLAIFSLIFGKKYRIDTVGWFGLLMIAMSLWLFSESQLRQLIFQRPSLSRFMSFVPGDLIAVFACKYFDAMQHKVYRRRYTILEAVVIIRLISGFLLDITGVISMYKAVWTSHILAGVCCVLVIWNIITDCIKGRIKTYRISGIGVILFAATAIVESFMFYSPRTTVYCTYVSVGFMVMLVATLLQTIHDIAEDYRVRERKRTELTINTIETIAGAIDARDEYTGGHSERVALYAGILAREVAESYGFTEEDIQRIGYIGLVHDIGKIGVADGVLNKTGRLTDEEFSLMKRHTEIGYGLMISMGDEVEGVLEGIRNHHERYDGKGYPDGLSGEDIPLVARILALADSYDAMTSNRVYRKRLTDEEVRNELLRCSGAQFDPALCEAFVSLIDRGEIVTDTEEGIATDSEGKLRSSSVLENRLSRDLHHDVKVLHPSHVRMLCYLLKLMEKMDRHYCVLMVGTESMDAPNGEDFDKELGRLTGQKDVNIKYTEDSNLVALYERSEDEIKAFSDSLTSGHAGVAIERII